LKLFLREANFVDGFLLLGRDHKKRLTKVMRLQSGDTVDVLIPGHHWECAIDTILRDAIQLRMIRELPPPPKPRVKLILGQAIPKGDRFEWLIQKATELGVSDIYPLITRRTIPRPADPDFKVQRWNEIADHAAEQSESSYPAAVHEPQTLRNFLQQHSEGLRLFLHERQHSESLSKVLADHHPDSITFIVGPEGGWSPEETDEIEAAGFTKVHLGSRILRAETAGLALAAILQYICGDFSG
jgi:16S rRNA (uracil1498-N3)-methyltransferase